MQTTFKILGFPTDFIQQQYQDGEKKSVFGRKTFVPTIYGSYIKDLNVTIKCDPENMQKVPFMLDPRTRVAAGLYLVDSIYFNILCDGTEEQQDYDLKQQTLRAAADLLFIPFVQTAVYLMLIRYKIY